MEITTTSLDSYSSDLDISADGFAEIELRQCEYILWGDV